MPVICTCQAHIPWAPASSFTSGCPFPRSLPGSGHVVSMGLILPLLIRDSTQSSQAHHRAEGESQDPNQTSEVYIWDSVGRWQRKALFALKMLGEETCWSPFASQATLSVKSQMTAEGRSRCRGLHPGGAL